MTAMWVHRTRGFRIVSAGVVIGVVGGLSAAASASAATPAVSAARNALPATAPSWTAKAAKVGPAPATAPVSARIYLAPQGGLSALASLATSISTPGSTNYGKKLSAAQYKATYAPTAAGVQTVSSFLSSNGLTVTTKGVQNDYVAFTGTVAEAEKAFGVTINRYKHNGATVQAPAGAVTLPVSFASSVLTVEGLDTSQHYATPPRPAAAPPAGFRNAHPCSIYYGQVQATYKADFSTPLPPFNGKTLAYAPCGYTGPFLRAAYEGNTNLDGSGVTVAITDAYAAPTIASDAKTYATNNGDGAYVPGQLTQTKASPFTHGAQCGPSGWYGEETLDVEAVHAMAPAANIHFYGAASCFDNDLLDSLAQVVVDDTAQLVTNSWGEPEEGEDASLIPAYEAVFLQGAIEGISFLFSSGDNGDELANTGYRQSDYPTSDPFVTSVGGTSTEIGSSGAITEQTGWGTVKYSLSTDGKSWNPVGFLYGSGGGFSALFNKPAYQGSAVPGAYRGVPDVAMDADPNTGMLIGETQTFPDGTYYDQYRIGGTSLASPLFAGLTALAIEHAGTAVGLLNPTIYAHAAAFTDVQGTPKAKGDVRVDFANGVNGSGGLLYSVRTFDQDSSLTINKGWDDVTGLGAGSPAWITAIGARG
jgi:subtilase family serine protease